ncbi:zonular occludens toxin domain-containing protein [Pulveribacter sp.]|uniref:zonular occludens toxin domain-containing protein n=1 Tax=Pulveribacter sp. TaxID=2678893 RepID=UPI0028AB0C4C|nr:zonular occludens toxin domain-containing protein [Pulveribacter sp.]
MITGLEGIPGSGKSYEAVVYHVLPALQAGRKVITNLPLNLEAFAALDPSYPGLIEVRTRPAPRLGDWNAANIAEQEAFQLWPDREPEPQPENVFTFGTVWDFYSTWRGPKGEGPLFVIDECHVALPKIGTPDHVVQWFKLHRHYNADVLLMTQSFRDINQPIAQLLASLIKCRKADILGKADRYIRKVHAGYRGAEIQRGERPYKAQYFQLYRSNTQSTASAEASAQDVAPFVVKFRRFQWLYFIAAALYVLWAFWPQDGVNVWGMRTTPTPQAQQRATVAAAPVQHVQQAPARQDAPRRQEPQQEAPPAAPVEPLQGKALHITGALVQAGRDLTVFVVSMDGRRIFDTTSAELEQAGYYWRRINHCMGWLTFEGTRRPITCDAPALNDGSQGRPLVIDSGTGARSHT